MELLLKNDKYVSRICILTS